MGTLNSDKGIIPIRGYNPCKHLYTSNRGVPKYIKKILIDIKGKINSNTVIVRDCNTPFIPKDRFSRKEINKETATLNDTTDQLDSILSEHFTQGGRIYLLSKCTWNFFQGRPYVRPQKS